MLCCDVDEVRDTKSDLSKETGVPDPTFGGQDSSSQWNNLKKGFELRVDIHLESGMDPDCLDHSR